MEKLNLKDKKLLYWLDQNSRTTNKELGKKVGLTEQAIGYKLKRLEEKGIIKKYVTFVNTLALGYQHYKVLLRLENINIEKENEIIKYLTNNNNIRWVVSCSGKWDINFSIMAKKPEDFVMIYRKIEEKYGNYIAEKQISLLINSPGFTRGHLINQKSEKILEYQAKKEYKIDKIDKLILKSISQNSRKNIIDISRETGATIDIVRYRLKKLENNKIISGYTIQLGLGEIGISRYSVYFSLHKMNEIIDKRMMQFAKYHSNVIFILNILGFYDLSLELEVLSHKDLENTIKKFREEFSENIKDFEIILNTNEHKYDFFPFKV